MLEVRLLGQFDVRRDGTPLVIPSRAAQSLFAYLLLTAGTAHRREKLAGLLWPDTTDENARSNLRNELWRLRKAIETKTPRKKAVPYLLVDEISIGFNAESDYWLDVSIVQKTLAEQASADHLIETLSLYRGELLPGFYDEWVVLERERVRAVFEQKMARLLELLVKGKRWQDTLEWGERWIALGQTPEPAYRALMVAHGALGNVSQVAAVYERCVQAMHNDLGVEPSEQTHSLFENLKLGKQIPKTSLSKTIPKQITTSNIPVPLTSFIGREKELEEIAKLLSGSRLLTLTGSGGVGKTRLAIQTAHDSIKKFKDGVCWVDLVGLTDATLIPQGIAQSLKVREVSNVPLIETLKNELRPKDLLLILDNCEHLIETAAQIAEQLLSGCPKLEILVTSRERLGVFNEMVWRVPSLGENTSLQLFAERAHAAQNDFSLIDSNERFISQICERLDGIPLAIELAAARVAVLSVEEIAKRLDDRFSLLSSGSRTALPRQQTLRATIDWSHDLLNEPERILLRRLSVFAGGFTLQAAESVCSYGALKPRDILEILARLVDKSLVIAGQGIVTGETRYHMLETIRQYALEKLAGIGEARTIRDQHLDFFVKLADEAEPRIFSGEAGIWFRRIEKELDNFRAATEWSTHSGKAVAALQIAGSLVYFMFVHGPLLSEWQDRMQQAFARPEGMERTLARAKALNAIGFFVWADVYPTDRRSELEEALSIGRELGDQWNIATALRNLGLLACIQGNYGEARSYLEQSLAIWKKLGSQGTAGMSWTLLFLGDAALNQGEAEQARSIYEQANAILRELGDINFLAYSVRRLSLIAWRENDFAGAAPLCKESLILNQESGDRRGVIACMAGFAAIAARRRQLERAAKLMASVETQLGSIGIRLLPVDQTEYEHNLEAVRAQLDKSTLVMAWSEGASMTIEQAIAFALEDKPGD